MAQDKDIEGDWEEEIEQDSQEGWPWEGGDDEVDPELLALGQSGGGDSVLRPILLILVLVMGGFILSDWQEELSYFFSAKQPVELGAVTDFPERRAEDPNWAPNMPHNRYVRISGIAENPTISRRYKYFKLIGGEVYVETVRDDAETSELEQLQKDRYDRGNEESEYFQFAQEGRALSFAAMPKRYTTLRQYYSRSANTTFCVDLDDQTRQQLERKQRETIYEVWRERYEAATPEERASKDIGPEPNQAQMNNFIEIRPVCVDAWLIQAGKAPGDHWWYVVLAGMFALFMLVDFYFLVRWVIRFMKPDDDL